MYRGKDLSLRGPDLELLPGAAGVSGPTCFWPESVCEGTNSHTCAPRLLVLHNSAHRNCAVTL